MVTKIFRDLNGALSLSTIKRSVKMINETDAIKLSNSSGHLRTVHTKDPKCKATIKSKKKSVDQKVGKRIVYVRFQCPPYSA